MDQTASAIAEYKHQDAKQPGVSFMQIREGRCKFPLGRIDEPPLRFCGKPTVIGLPYCTNCQRIVYVPKPRR